MEVKKKVRAVVAKQPVTDQEMIEQLKELQYLEYEIKHYKQDLTRELIARLAKQGEFDMLSLNRSRLNKR